MHLPEKIQAMSMRIIKVLTSKTVTTKKVASIPGDKSSATCLPVPTLRLF